MGKNSKKPSRKGIAYAAAAVCACLLLAILVLPWINTSSDTDITTSVIDEEATQQTAYETGSSQTGETPATAAESESSGTVGTASEVPSSATGKPSVATGNYSSLSKSDIPAVDESAEGSAYEAGHVLILFDESADMALAQGILDECGLSMEAEDLSECLESNSLCEADIIDGSSVAAATEKLAFYDAVRFAQPNYLYTLADTELDEIVTADELAQAENVDVGLLSTVDDPYAEEQWQLDAINAYDAWNKTQVNGSVSVAIIDTGAEANHPDLAGRIVDGYNSVDYSSDITPVHWHGTHVAGIIGATSDNDIGVSGVSYNPDLIIIQASQLYQDEACFTTKSICEAYNYLLTDSNGNGVADAVENYNLHVINMSLGAEGADDPVADALIDDAFDQGILTVCASGNDDSDAHYWPCDYENCVSVIALDEDLARADYSNYGVDKDISAPGSYILSTYLDGEYAYASGTSMASPVVAGVAAMVYAQNPGAGAQEVRDILEATAMDLGEEGYNIQTAWGCVDALGAVNATYGQNTVTLNSGDYAQ
ncbi:MAG: S8 family serine peptidase, partial [Eggerthellaceae bacterium]|nr:S8 family serine peptidase [Eggerthellaceae bacterium]